MLNYLFFCFIKEYNNTKSMAGKIWKIKVLSGELHVDDKVSLFAVDYYWNNNKFNRVDAVIKHIKRDIVYNENDLYEIAKQGDIVTINLKQCYADGKKINKSEIAINNTSVGYGYNVVCKSINSLKIKFYDYSDFIIKLNISLEKSIIKQQKYLQENIKVKKLNMPTACVVSLLWFGKVVPIEVVDINYSDDFSTNNTLIEFKLVNNKYLSIPLNENLQNIIKNVVIKDYFCTEKNKNDKNVIHRWKYYKGEMFFDN